MIEVIYNCKTGKETHVKIDVSNFDNIPVIQEKTIIEKVEEHERKIVTMEETIDAIFWGVLI